MSGRRYGPVTQTSPSDSKGWTPVLRMTYLWWTSVAPAESIALTGQYFVADSSMVRRMAASSRRGPSNSWVTSTRVRTWGYSSRCSPWTWIEYRLMRCRFLVAIEMTSMALHAARATVTVSIGLISAAAASPPHVNVRPVPVVVRNRVLSLWTSGAGGGGWWRGGGRWRSWSGRAPAARVRPG